MKFNVGYAVVSWSGGKVVRKKTVVSAESKVEAVKEVVVMTKGKAYNIVAEEV